jgi:outer membrane protein OmpA-like peptidoglycan-associated protein
VAASPTRAELGRKSWRINFDTGKDTFRSDATPVLTQLMQGLVVAGPTAIEIHGHTDNVGTEQANEVLSEKRAFAVKSWLRAQGSENFPDHRFRIFAHGAEEPVRPNDSEQGRAANRRVEIVLLTQ